MTPLSGDLQNFGWLMAVFIGVTVTLYFILRSLR